MASSEESMRDKLRASVLAALKPAATTPEPEAAAESPAVEEGEPESKVQSPKSEVEEPEVEVEEPEEPEAEETPKEKARLEEIRNLRSDRRALRDELGELKEEVGKLKEAAAASPPPGPAGSASPLANVQTAEELTQFERKLRTQVRTLEDYLDGSLEGAERVNVENWAKANGHWNTAEGAPNLASLKRLKRSAEELLADDVPARREHLQSERTASQRAEATFPWWNERESEEYAMAQRAVKKYPWIKQAAEWKEALGLIVLGAQALGKQIAANGGRAKPGGPARVGNPKLPRATVALPTAVTRPTAPTPDAEFGEGVKTGDRARMKAGLVAMLKTVPAPTA